jgi:hypothetical protein
MRLAWLVLPFGLLALGCSNGSHATTCNSSADCHAGNVCVDSHCVASPGDAGICHSGCQCTTANDCLAGAPSCVTGSCLGGSCMFQTNDSLCAAGQTCDLFGGCSGGDAGATFDAGANVDVGTDVGVDAPSIDVGPPDTNVLSPLGGPCMRAMDCAPIMAAGGRTAQCLTTQSGFPLPGGYCTIACATFGSTCPTGSECVSAGGGGGFCAATCTASTECRVSEGYDCRIPRRGTGGLMMVCVPMGF